MFLENIWRNQFIPLGRPRSIDIRYSSSAKKYDHSNIDSLPGHLSSRPIFIRFLLLNRFFILFYIFLFCESLFLILSFYFWPLYVLLHCTSSDNSFRIFKHFLTDKFEDYNGVTEKKDRQCEEKPNNSDRQKLRCSGRASSSCSASGTRCRTLV